MMMKYSSRSVTVTALTVPRVFLLYIRSDCFRAATRSDPLEQVSILTMPRLLKLVAQGLEGMQVTEQP